MKKGTVIRNFDNYLLKQGYRRLNPTWRDRLREAYWTGYELGLSKETDVSLADMTDKQIKEVFACICEQIICQLDDRFLDPYADRPNGMRAACRECAAAIRAFELNTEAAKNDRRVT